MQFTSHFIFNSQLTNYLFRTLPSFLTTFCTIFLEGTISIVISSSKFCLAGCLSLSRSFSDIFLTDMLWKIVSFVFQRNVYQNINTYMYQDSDPRSEMLYVLYSSNQRRLFPTTMCLFLHYNNINKNLFNLFFFYFERL